ncbi:MAG: hypothetical protein HFK10_05795 [Clostridia bacterium]|nr:hypothetical protein [Clostridia bacterium]
MATVKRWIVRFRLPIIIVATLLVAALAAFLATKGTIITNVTLSTQVIHYGDEYELSDAKALFGSVSGYEYTPIGSEAWTTEKPVRAGQYYVRAVTRGGFGRKRGEAVAFEILPRATEFSVRDEQVVYGDDPRQIELPLVDGDMLSVSALRYIFDDYSAEETFVAVDLRSVRIADGRGNDVTDCYTFTTQKQAVRFLDKDITVRPRAVNKVFDGAGLVFDNTVDDDTQAALRDDGVTFATIIRDKDGNIVEAPTLAGRYTVEIDPDSVKIVKNGVDVTARYTFTCAPTVLVVEPKPLTVVTATETKIYDGAPLFSRAFTADTQVAGHTVVCTTETTVERTTVGTTKNEYAFTVVDESGEDVADNYMLQITCGTLTVEPRSVSIVTASAKSEYDGTALSADRYACDETQIADGQTLRRVGEAVSIADADTVENRLAFEVFDRDGNPVTDNYRLHVTYGTLTVTPRRIAVMADSVHETYDGDTWSAPTATVAHADGGAFGLVSGDRCAVENKNKIIYIRNAGTVANDYAASDYVIRDAFGRDVTRNYQIISVKAGTLTLDKRAITITTETDEREYDGKPLKNTDCKYEGLIPGQTIGADTQTVTQITNVGTVENKTQFIISADRQIVTANYAVTYVYGTLTVTPRNVWIETASANKIYDATPLSSDETNVHHIENGQIIVNNSGLVLSHKTVRISSEVSIIDVGRIVNEKRFAIFDGNKDVTENYVIWDEYYTFGTLEITRRPVSIQVGSKSSEYDGTAHSCAEAEVFEFGEYRLVDGHTMKVEAITFETDATDPNGVPNIVNVTIFDGTRDVTHNYALDYLYGRLTVTPRRILVTTPDAEKTYDGTALYRTERTAFTHIATGLQEKAFVLDHAEKLLDFAQIVHTWESVTGNNTAAYDVIDGAGNSVGKNYALEYDCGTLTVNKRAISIVTGSASKEYDDEWLREERYRSVDNLLDWQLLYPIADTVTEIRDAVSVENKTQYTVYDPNIGMDVTEDYTISYPTLGTLTITQKPITVTRDSLTREYDRSTSPGLAVFPESITIDGNAYWLDAQLIDGHVYAIDSATLTNICDVGEVENLTEYRILADRVTRDVTANYAITYTKATLKITPRLLRVTINSNSWEYDGTPHSDKNATAKHVVDDGAGGYVEDGASALGTNPPHALVLTGETVTATNVWDSGRVNTYAVRVDDGNDGKNYQIVAVIDGKLEITKRTLNVTRTDCAKVYDGDPLRGDRATGDRLVGGHTLRALDPITEITNVWESGKAIETRFTVVTADGAETVDGHILADNYQITHLDDVGVLTVTARPITVSTPSGVKTYDGTPLVGDRTVTCTRGGLVKNHTFAVGGSVSITDAGTRKNDFAIFVSDGTGNVTANYELTYEYGTLTVNQRPIEITTPSGSKVYDGAPLTVREGEKITKGDLVLDHRLRLSTAPNLVNKFGTITNVGTEKNVLSFDVVTEDGTNVSHNYARSYIDGTLTVTPRTVYIRPESVTHVYDGALYTYSGAFEYYGDSASNSGNQLAIVNGEREQLQLSVVYQNVLSSILQYGTSINVGLYLIEIDLDKCTIPNGNRRISNYDFVCGSSVLTIEARPIVFVAPADETEYSGNAVAVDGYAYETYLQGNRAQQGLTVIDKDNIAVEYVYYNERGEVCVPKDAGRYRIEIANVLYENAAGNYRYDVADAEPGELVIIKREVSIRLVEGEKDYDGVSVAFGDWLAAGQLPYVDVDDRVVPGETLVLRGVTFDGGYPLDRVVDAGTYAICLDAVQLAADNPNYSIHEVQTAYYTIRPLAISVGNSDLTATYTGAPIFAPQVIGTSNISEEHRALIESLGHTIRPSGERYSVLNVGTYVNRQSVTIVDKDGRDCSHNYAITFVSGTITVLPKEITVSVRPKTPTVVYNGMQFAIAEDELTVVGLVADHALQVAAWTEMVNAGTYTDYVMRTYSVVTADGSDESIVEVDGIGVRYKLKDNYAVVYDRASITIEKREVTFRVGALSPREYSATEQPLTRDECLDGDFETLDTAFALAAYTATGSGFDSRLDYSLLKNAGTYTVIVKKNDMILDGVKGNPNYTIHGAETLTFVVTIDRYLWTKEGRAIVVHTASGVKPYDGTPLSRPVGAGSRPLWLTGTDGTFPSVVAKVDPTATAPFVLELGDSAINRLRFILEDASGVDVSANFDFGAFGYDDETYYAPGSLRIASEIRLELHISEILYEGAVFDREGDATDGYIVDSRDGGGDVTALTFHGAIRQIDRLVGDEWQRVGEVCDAGTYRICYGGITDANGVELRLNGQSVALRIAQKFEIQNDMYDGMIVCYKTVRPRRMYARPIDIRVVYAGVNVLKHGETDFELFGVGNDGTAAGHTFRIVSTSDFLDIAARQSVQVTITAGQVVDSAGSDVTANYRIYYEFVEGETTDVRKSDFKGQLRFDKHDVAVTPIAPENNRFYYDGEKHAIEFSGDGEELFVCVGLLDGHVAKVDSAEVAANPGARTNWLKLKIFDADGVDVSRGYKIKTVVGDRSTVYVDPADLRIESGSAAKPYDGTPLTCGDATVTVNGATLVPVATSTDADGAHYEYELFGNHRLRVCVSGSVTTGIGANVFSYNVYRTTASGETDVSKYYSVTPIYGTLTIE